MSHETNHPTPGSDPQWPFTLAQQEVIAMLPEAWQDQVKRNGPAATLHIIAPTHPVLTGHGVPDANAALLALVADYHDEDVSALKRAASLLDGQSASSQAEQEQAVTDRRPAVKQNPPYTSVEHQLLCMLPKKMWHQAETKLGGLADLIYTEIPEISGCPRLTQIVALIGITRDDVWMCQAAGTAHLSTAASMAATTAVRHRRKRAKEELAAVMKAATPPEPPTEALTYESFTRALQYFNEQSRKTGVSLDAIDTAHLRADQQAWERDSLDYVKPDAKVKQQSVRVRGLDGVTRYRKESLAETFGVPERFVTPAQQTWDPAEPATTWSAAPEKDTRSWVLDHQAGAAETGRRIVPTREQAMGLGGAAVTTNTPEPTTPQGPMVEESPALFDVPEPREELHEQLRTEATPPPVDENGLTENMRAALAVTSPVLQSSVREEGVIGAAERYLGYYRTQQLLGAVDGKDPKATLLMELVRMRARLLLGDDTTLDEFATLLGVDYTPEPEPEFDMVEHLNRAVLSAHQAARALTAALAKAGEVSTLAEDV